MNIKQLDAFLAVAESRSFTQAARTLGIAQPTVTARIKALEQILDAPLLDRASDGARLTPAGRRLHSYACRIVRLSDLAQNVVSEPAYTAAPLAIGAAECITTYRLVPLIEYLHLRHRPLQMSLRTIDDDPVSLVREERVDCAFFIGPRPAAHDVRHHTLRPESLSLVARPSHPLVGEFVGSARDFAADTVVCAHRGIGYQRSFEAVLAAAGEPAGGVLAVGSVDAVKRSVGEGIGIALLPTVAVRDELRGGLLGRIGWGAPFEVFSQCVWRRGLDDDSAFATVLDAARQVMAEDDPTDGAALRPAC